MERTMSAVTLSATARAMMPPTLDVQRRETTRCRAISAGPIGVSTSRTRPVLPNLRACWVAGFSFGAWIGMQLLMRRPEVEGFISIAPPANLYDFSFLAPCPSSGLIVHGEKDAWCRRRTSIRWSRNSRPKRAS